MKSRMIVLSGLLVLAAGCAAAQQPAPPTTTTVSSPTATAATTKSAADLVDGIVRAAQGKKTYHVRLVPLDHEVTNPAEGTVRIRQLNGGVDNGADLDLTVQARLNPSTQTLRFVTLNSKTFVKVTAAYNPPPGKPWVALRRETDDTFTNNIMLINDMAAQEAVPTAYLLPLLAAGGEITGSAPEGQATRYRITLDLQRAADKLTDPYLKEEMETGLKEGGKTLDYELLTDAQNTLLSAKSFVKAVRTGESITTEIQFDKWGEPADITEPPAAETITR